jgi:hypothetical protein
VATPQLLISALLHRQAGVVSRTQALRCGLTSGQIDRLVARRRWRPVHPRVYRAADHGFTDEARVRAAVLWAGDGAVASGRAALWWHGLLPEAPETITLRVPRRCADPPTGVLWRQITHCEHHDEHVVTLRGLPVPVPALALLDAAVETGAGGAALLRGHDLAELRAVADHAVSPIAARRLLADVSCTPPGDRAEQQTYRNRYS